MPLGAKVKARLQRDGDGAAGAGAAGGSSTPAGRTPAARQQPAARPTPGAAASQPPPSQQPGLRSFAPGPPQQSQQPPPSQPPPAQPPPAQPPLSQQQVPPPRRLNRELSIASTLTHETLEQIELEVLAMQRTCDAAEQTLSKIATSDQLEPGLRNSLAQLHGNANKLLATRIDAILTSAPARALPHTRRAHAAHTCASRALR